MPRPAAPAVLAVVPALVLALLVVLPPAPAAAERLSPAVEYGPPVDAPVVDGFRPPATPFGAGNRGLEYATALGGPVSAAAPGTVTFAGQVGGTLHVVVRHADGIRTSYSFLDSVLVRAGQPVARGQPVGTSGPRLHFGARDEGGDYLDPALLLSPAGRHVRLVADDGRPLATARDDAGALAALVRAVGEQYGQLSAAAAGWARAGVVAAASVGTAGAGAAVREVEEASGPTWAAMAAALADVGGRWPGTGVAGSPCTPALEPPPSSGARRRVVLVGGLGSTSAHAAVTAVDAATLGYAPRDVAVYSYRGGTTAERPYGSDDTQGDIRASGRRLRALLARMAAAEPGVPIDVIAHSQGGLVARFALTGPSPPPVANLVMLGTPNHGADLATAVAEVRRAETGRLAEDGLAASGATDLHAGRPAIRELSQLSAFVRWLNAQPPPSGPRLTSIAARADLVVPSPRSWLEGATNVVVSVGGVDQHGDLPGSPAAHRELALALAGRPPTCQRPLAVAADAVAGRLITMAEDTAGAVVAARARDADRELGLSGR